MSKKLILSLILSDFPSKIAYPHFCLLKWFAFPLCIENLGGCPPRSSPQNSNREMVVLSTHLIQANAGAHLALDLRPPTLGAAHMLGERQMLPTCIGPVICTSNPFRITQQLFGDLKCRLHGLKPNCNHRPFPPCWQQVL